MHTISYTGTIQFEPENRTKKHMAQASWKKVAMVLFDGDIAEYYSWFLKKRFNLELNKPLRGAHITFINDRMDDINNSTGTIEEKESAWEALKNKWDGKEINVVLNLRPFSDDKHWWLIVDHKFRNEIHDIRKEIGLEKPYFGLHMTFGILNQNYKMDNEGKLELDSNGRPISIFNHQLEHAKYLNVLHENGFVEMNKDYGLDNEIMPVNNEN